MTIANSFTDLELNVEPIDAEIVSLSTELDTIDTTAAITAPAVTLKPGSAEHAALITGSKVAGIFGASKFSSPRKEFYLLRAEIDPDGETDAMVRGTMLEPSILNWFFHKFPQFDRVGGETTVLREGVSWGAANLDDIAIDRETGERYNVEAKSDGRGDYQWGREYSSDVPLGYWFQVQWGMWISGLRRTYIPVLGPFLELKVFIVDYDEVEAEKMAAYLHTFYLNAKSDDAILPPVDGSEHTYDAIRTYHRDIEKDLVHRTDYALARRRFDSMTALAAAEAEVNLVKSLILDEAGQAHKIIAPDGQPLGNRQKTKKGVALYPPRAEVSVDALDAHELDAMFAPDAIAAA